MTTQTDRYDSNGNLTDETLAAMAIDARNDYLDEIAASADLEEVARQLAEQGLYKLIGAWQDR